MKEQIRLAFVIGAGLATSSSACALGPFILSGADTFEKHQTTIVAAIDFLVCVSVATQGPLGPTSSTTSNASLESRAEALVAGHS